VARLVSGTLHYNHISPVHVYRHWLLYLKHAHIFIFRFSTGARVQICSRYCCLGSALQWWSCKGPSDAVSFQADRDIEIVGVAVYGGKEGGQHNVSVELLEESGEVGNAEPLSKLSGQSDCCVSEYILCVGISEIFYVT